MVMPERYQAAIEPPDRLCFSATEDLIVGGQILRRALLETPMRSADRGTRLVDYDGDEPPVMLLRTGFVYRSCMSAESGRAIVDVFVPGDIVGIEHAVFVEPADNFTAANRVEYHALVAAEVRELMTDPRVALYACALLAGSCSRASKLAVAIGRFEARTRLCMLFIDIYDRLCRRRLIDRPTYYLPLTQKQLADHLGLTIVHVNRTLRSLHDENLVIVDRQMVSILDVARARAVGRVLSREVESAPEPVFGQKHG